MFKQPNAPPRRLRGVRGDTRRGGNRRFSIKLATAMFTAALALAPAVGLAQVLPPNNPNSTTFTFPLKVSPGAATCLPNAKGVVIAHTFGNVENLEVVVTGLPPNRLRPVRDSGSERAVRARLV